MADKDITIGLQTTGADEAVRDIDKVPEAMGKIPEAADAAEKGGRRIVDATKRNTEALDENVKAFKEWQDGLQKANRAAGQSSVAVTRELEEQERAARQAAAAASNLAAAEEAAAIRRGIAAKKLTEELLEEAKKRRDQRESQEAGGLLGVDLTTGAQKAGQLAANKAGLGGEFRALSQVISADSAAIAGSFAAIVAAAVGSYNALDGTLDRFDKLKELAKETGQELGPELSIQLEALRETMGPVKAVIDTVGGALDKVWKTVKDPVGELTGANDLEAAFRRQAEQAQKLLEARQKIATDNQTDIVALYKREADGLKEQEETLRRIGVLRGQLESIEQQRANRQVEFARREGGDVALAETNALAARLKAEINTLNENLRQSQADVAAGQQTYDAAVSAYNRGLTDKLDPKKTAELGLAVDAAAAALAKSQTIASEQAVLFETSKANIVEGIDNSLRDLETKYKDGVSQKTDAAMSGLVDTMKEALANGPAAAIQQIQVEAGAITTAANEQAAQVQQGLSTERAGTVQAIQQLAPQPQDIQAVTRAAQESNKAINELGNAMISGFASMQATMNQVLNRMAGQQTQINQLFGRLR